MPPQTKDRCRKATKTPQQKKKLRTQYQTYQDDKDKSLPNGKLQVTFSCLERGPWQISLVYPSPPLLKSGLHLNNRNLTT